MGNQQQVDLGKYDKSQAGTQETDETQIADKQQKYEAPKMMHTGKTWIHQQLSKSMCMKHSNIMKTGHTSQIKRKQT